MQHLDEMTCLMYIERQLDRARAQDVSAHTQDCAACRTLMRALERESRLLTRAMLEEEEPLPARLAEFRERAKRSLQWIWGLALDWRQRALTPSTPAISNLGSNNWSRRDLAARACWGYWCFRAPCGKDGNR